MILGREDLLLHVCLHAADHHILEMGVRPLCDVQAIIQRHGNTLDWNVVVQRAHEWKVERSLALVLALARDYLGVSVPSSVDVQLATSMPPLSVLQDAMEFIFEHAKHLAGTSEPATRLLEIRGTGARLRHVATEVWRPAVHPHLDKRPGRRRLKRLSAAAARAFGLSWRHAGWLWRASRDRNSPLHEAVDRRNALAAWIRGR